MRPFFGRLLTGAGSGVCGAGDVSVIGATGSGAGTAANSSAASGKSGSFDDGDTATTGGTAGAAATFVRGADLRRGTALGRSAGFTAGGGGAGSSGERCASSGGGTGGGFGKWIHAPENMTACSTTETKAAVRKRREPPGVTAALRAWS